MYCPFGTYVCEILQATCENDKCYFNLGWKSLIVIFSTIIWIGITWIPVVRYRLRYLRWIITAIIAFIQIIGINRITDYFKSLITNFVIRRFSKLIIENDNANIYLKYYWEPTKRYYKIAFPTPPIKSEEVTHVQCGYEQTMRDYRLLLDMAGPGGDFHGISLTPLELGYTSIIITTTNSKGEKNKYVIDQNTSFGEFKKHPEKSVLNEN